MLGELIREAAARFGDRPAYVGEDGSTVTYAGLDSLSDEVAAGLAARGVGEGDVVALVLPTTPAYPVLYAAIAKLGAVLAGVNTRLPGAERAAVLAVARPKLVVDGDDPLGGLRDAGRIGAPVDHDPDRPVAIVFTSGTTGTPKGALFCNRQLAAITRIDVGDTWDGGGTSLLGTSLAHLGFVTKSARR